MHVFVNKNCSILLLIIKLLFSTLHAHIQVGLKRLILVCEMCRDILKAGGEHGRIQGGGGGFGG